MNPWTEVATPADQFVASGLKGLPDPVRAVLSMLSYEERALLFELARRSAGEGAIIDAGCFLGGSTLSLATGLAASPSWRPRCIHTYDRFKFEQSMVAYADDDLQGMEIGSSIRPIFEQNVALYREAITVHEGDILEERWTGEPIETLFIDLCKTWPVNAHVVREFFPALIPGRSVVIQQDLVHWNYPWCAIVMECLTDYFEYLGWASFSSSVWKCTRVPPESILELDWKHDIGLDRGLELLRRAAKRHTGWAVPYLELARVTLMREFFDDEGAQNEIQRVRGEYGTSVPYLEHAYADLERPAPGSAAV